MQYLLVAQLLVLIGVANGAPLLVAALLGPRLARPLDGGATFSDRRPGLGSRKPTTAESKAEKRA
jgi:CDP-2,3-bis-(O-geranylgeranyl)-sn-glycerol synthase